MMNFEDFAANIAQNSHLADLIEQYDNDPETFSDEDVEEMVIYAAMIADEDEGIYPEDDYYEDWDHIELGFDPYMGMYSDDC